MIKKFKLIFKKTSLFRVKKRQFFIYYKTFFAFKRPDWFFLTNINKKFQILKFFKRRWFLMANFLISFFKVKFPFFISFKTTWLVFRYFMRLHRRYYTIFKRFFSYFLSRLIVSQRLSFNKYERAAYAKSFSFLSRLGYPMSLRYTSFYSIPVVRRRFLSLDDKFIFDFLETQNLDFESFDFFDALDKLDLELQKSIRVKEKFFIYRKFFLNCYHSRCKVKNFFIYKKTKSRYATTR